MAVRAYRRLIREYPDVGVLYERLEKIYRNTGRDEEMIKILKGSEKDNSQRERLLKRLVRLETRLGRLKAARHDLEKIKGYRVLARAYKNLGDWEGARNSLTQADLIEKSLS